MNIIIVGCGKVGAALAAELNVEGNNVTIVDKSPQKVKYIATKHDIMGVIGNGATRDIQREAGVDSADLLIAVTGSDELNLLCCVIAKRAGNCRTIARIESPDYVSNSTYLRDELGLAMVINPYYRTAREITRILSFPTALKVETFSRGRVELMKFRLPENSPLVGISLRDVMIKLQCNVQICSVERGDEAYIPNGDFVFAERDVISVIASLRTLKEFVDKVGFDIHPVKNAVIVGGGTITHYLCEMLDKSGISLKIIEKDHELCERLSSDFDGVTVIEGDPANEDVLREERAAASDAFVALTSIDEENILLSLFAKGAGNAKIITKINKIEYTGVISHLDLDSIVYPKNITTDLILRYVRAMQNTAGSNMETLYNLIKGEVEVAEFTISQDSAVVGIPISQLKLKANVLIAAIIRGKQMIIPRGQATIEPGDSVVVVTKLVGLHDISDLLDKQRQ